MHPIGIAADLAELPFSSFGYLALSAICPRAREHEVAATTDRHGRSLRIRAGFTADTTISRPVDADSSHRRARLSEADCHGRAGGHTARMTSADLALDSSATALISPGSDVQMTAPVAAAIIATVASTTSEVPARPQRIPAALAVSSPTGSTWQPARNPPRRTCRRESRHACPTTTAGTRTHGKPGHRGQHGHRCRRGERSPATLTR